MYLRVCEMNEDYMKMHLSGERYKFAQRVS